MIETVSRRNFIKATSLGLISIMSVGLSKHAFAGVDNNSLNETDINSRFLKIHRKYSVGDTLSSEDYEFVKKYSIPCNDISTYDTRTISANGYWNGHTYDLRGNCYLNGFSNYTWGGTLQTGSATITSKTKTVRLGISAYSIGTLIYDNILSNSGGSGTNWYTAEFNGAFTGLPTTYYFYYEAIIETNDGHMLYID